MSREKGKRLEDLLLGGLSWVKRGYLSIKMFLFDKLQAMLLFFEWPLRDFSREGLMGAILIVVFFVLVTNPLGL